MSRQWWNIFPLTKKAHKKTVSPSLSKILVYLLQHIIERFSLPVQPIEREFHIAWFTSTKNPCIWLAHHHLYFNLDHRCHFISQYFFLLPQYHHWCLYFWYTLSLSVYCRKDHHDLPVPYALSPIVWISLRIFQHRECHLYSYLRVKNHRCRYLLTQIQSRS